jgi:hypothetical protein
MGATAERTADAVLYTFCEPALCSQVRREFMRKALHNLTPILPTTACHQRNYIETHCRFIAQKKSLDQRE